MIEYNQDDIKIIEDALIKGVLIAGIDARDLMFYDGGIFDAKCTHDINHYVAIVGYGETKADDPEGPGIGFWIVKNSWG